jgi:hypothetical protein
MNIFDVVLWNNQSVATIGGKDVEECEAVLIVIDLVGRNGAFNYLAEDAI